MCECAGDKFQVGSWELKPGQDFSEVLFLSPSLSLKFVLENWNKFLVLSGKK